ncbi:type II toxin-antitoxin system RelE/ParE family toxin [Leeuwenhoekiella parthenopeia]|uniref:Toxin n=1 Tax=Leeuwenhoekiella parthenopeia TaxID=2890320 RepID=A0ABS8GPZ8_9FLAO|nr:type II toxin-antitoxin system RelE/ParE family toxin [Leeuwenhoekiella parthenopeia]MCC4212069.1 type II toxin-antitoxin system RelE/ParE family toxin [Leeuwenhoekiella parthenopeia]
MVSYKLSAKAEEDLVEIYKYGVSHFGSLPARNYLLELEETFLMLATRPELLRKASFIAERIFFYQFKGHTIFYLVEDQNEIFVVRVLGKRMDFKLHL